MNPSDPLAQLNPLREPAAIGWWPLAPGWWLLIALVLVAAGLLIWWALKRYRSNAYRRAGIAQLAQIQSHWERDGDNGQCLTHTNALLKAVALRGFPHRDIASINGERWRDFLNQSLDEHAAFELDPLISQYRAEADAIDVGAHLAASARWISQHRVST
jgi:Domain of unknown function (DUF4381)